jgi:hypothetical protein
MSQLLQSLQVVLRGMRGVTGRRVIGHPARE